MIKKTVSLILISALIALCFCACGKEKDITMIMPISADPMCLDPQIVDSEAGKIIVANCYEGLVRLDENYKIIPGAAKSWEISKDGLTYTFHLRENAVWQRLDKSHKEFLPEKFDTRVTAADFQFGLMRAVNPVTQCNDAEKFFCIKNALAINSGEAEPDTLGVKALNDTTLVITLERANPDFLRLLTLPAAMPCKEAFFKRTHAKYGLELKCTFCNGPFYLSRWADDNTLVIRRAEHYKGETFPAVGSVYFYVNNDEESVISKFRQNSYNCISLSDSGKKQLADVSKINYLESVNKVCGLCFNCGENFLYNPDIRTALLSVSKTDTLSLPDGAYAKAEGIIPDCCRFGDKSYREAAGKITRTNLDEKSARVSFLKGLKELELETLEIKITCTEDFTPQMKAIIQDWQRVFGTSIIAKVETLSKEDFAKAIKNGTYQIAAGTISANSSTAVDMLKMFTTDAKGNIFNYSSEEYDKLVEKIIKESAGNDILSDCKAAENLLVSDAVFYPLFTYSKEIAVNSDAAGIYTSPVFESIYFNIGGKK